MVRRAEGWKLRADRRTGIRYVRFRHQKIRYEVSTGQRDPGLAATEAARIYSEIVSGRWERHIIIARPGAPLDEIAAQWLADVEGECKPKTWGLYKLHIETHLVPFFKTLDRVTEQRWRDYRRMRLRAVLRETVIKEATTLRRFLRWAKPEKYIKEPPLIEDPPLGAEGTPDARVTKDGKPIKHKRKSIPVSLAEAKAILSELPERAQRARRGSHRHPVRDFFVVLWDSGLRPETVGALRAPVHFRKGGTGLHITADIDKVKYERDLPLTPAARAALERNCPEAGLIFGRHDFRVPFREACRRAAKAGKLEAWKAEQVTPYDFRHGRTTDLLERPGASLPGVSYLVGHRQITTTNRYVHAQRKAAEKTLLGSKRGAVGRKAGRDE